MDDTIKRRICVLLLLEEEEEEESQALQLLFRRRKRQKINELYLNRRQEGTFKLLVVPRLYADDNKFREYFRVNMEIFPTILSHIENDIATTPCNRQRFPISPQEKLCLTLRYMATGESFRSLAFQFRIHHSWISKIVKEVLESIRRRMLGVSIPKLTKECMKRNAEDYYLMWNFPNCCGAIDGKHIRIRCPDNAGSVFFNYKSFHSIILLAVVDAHYRFIAVDVGSYGREGDAGVFAKSAIGKQINDRNFNIPAPVALPGTEVVQPFVILGDEAFALTTTLMKPYPQEQAKSDKSKSVYNYRHCRARRTSENAFGILCQYFRVLYTQIAVNPDTATDLVLLAFILHNMLRNSKIPYPGESYTIENTIAIENMISLTASKKNRTGMNLRITSIVSRGQYLGKKKLLTG